MRLQVESVLKDAVDGDEAAREQLLALYRPYLSLISKRIIPAVLRKRGDSSDVIQQTLIDATSAIGDFRGESEPEFTAWITRILNGNATDFYRRNTAEMRDVRREAQLHDQSGSAILNWHTLSDDGSGPTERIIRGEEALELAAAIGKLPEDMATAITLRYIEAFKLAEIADAMDCTIGVVAGLIRRGLAQLSSHLPNPGQLDSEAS
ncbi:MAG: sigma-70 family RNA polymerase sigma factor [Planctomycetota bacterium]